MPDETTIEDLAGRVGIFFEDNAPTIFGIAFGDVSLTSLVTHVDAREKLASAEVHLAGGDLAESLREIALAFQTLVFDYTVGSFSSRGRSPFNFGTKPTFRSSFMMGIKDPKLSPFIDEVEKLGKSVQALQSAVQITSLGLDYRRYTKFRMLTPHVFTALGGVHQVDERDDFHPRLDDCRFCLSFAIDTALKLQQFDFEGAK